MKDYTLVHSADVDNRAPNGEFKMLKSDLGSKQVTLSTRIFPAHSGQRGGGGHKHQKIEEVLYVVKGELIVKLDDEEIQLHSGDALRIGAAVGRAYQNDSAEETFVVITSPVLPGGKSDGVRLEDFWS